MTAKNNADQLHKGETVVLTIKTANVKCMVFYAAGNSAILAPTQTLPELQSALNQLPISGLIRRDDGSDTAFTIRTNGAIQALAGDFQSQLLSNRRQAYRLKVDFQLKVSADGQHWYPVRGEDISEGGLCFNNPGFLKVLPEQTLLLNIQLIGCESISASGIIRRIDVDAGSTPGGPGKIGVQFTGLSANDHRKLVQFIYSHQAHINR